jgi:hypothetical protein
MQPVAGRTVPAKHSRDHRSADTADRATLDRLRTPGTAA